MPTQVEEIAEEIPKEPKYYPKCRWIIPQYVNQMDFIGKHILAVAQDLYIIFLNLSNRTETVYVADSSSCGDGVDVISGSKGSLFAFSEAVKNGKIFIVTFPSMKVVSQLKDEEVNRYKGICLMEGDIVGAISGFPNFIITVWNWRNHEKLISVPTGVVTRHKTLSASRISLLMCEFWAGGMNVWEVGQCYKKNFMLKRSKDEEKCWERTEPPLSDVCWTLEGYLYGVDEKAHLYAVVSDGIKMVTVREWSEEIPAENPNQTMVTAFSTGLLIYGPDDCIRLLKKVENNGVKWNVEWQYMVPDVVIKLVSNAHYDEAALWTETGRVYRIDTESEQTINISLFTYKQRNIKKIQMIAPTDTYIALMNTNGDICIYEIETAELITIQSVNASDVNFDASPVDPVLAIIGTIPNGNYGVVLVQFDPSEGLKEISKHCLTYQIVDNVVWAPDGRQLVTASMSAGHIFIFHVSPTYTLTLVRYAELSRGLADVCLLKVGESMRLFSLILFSDKYSIGERIVCIDAVSGKDNKFAGKMQGPYFRLLPLATKDTMMAIPHQQKQYHVLKLFGDKGVTVTVRMGPIYEVGHELRQYDAYFCSSALLTYGYDGMIIFREPGGPAEYELKLVASHRYRDGVNLAVIAAGSTTSPHAAALTSNGIVSLLQLNKETLEPPVHNVMEKILESGKTISVLHESDKNHLDVMEEKKVKEEAQECRKAREEVIKEHLALQKKLVELLEENISEPALHQLPMNEFNLHHENRRERLKQAEKERDEIRLATEARIAAQDKVTAWIKAHCWDSMQTQRVKLLALFSFYQVENFPVLPSQRPMWEQLQLVTTLRSVEAVADHDLFRPWEQSAGGEVKADASAQQGSAVHVDPISASMTRLSAAVQEDSEESLAVIGEPFVLSGTVTHKFVEIPKYMIPQTLSFSFLHMNMLQEITKLNTQNLRIWFNKQFDELMTIKKREVQLVDERNARLRFIVEELNKLSDLRGSFHHLNVKIMDPIWQQEEQPIRLIKVDPIECSIEPYISPSQIVIPPPEPQPKDDFKERALIEMMDGVLEKLWHEEIKKPIPKPQCMLDKDPEHFNEEDLKHVFEYERKVEFRNEEREKYRKMLHSEYAKLSAVLDEGIVKFNSRVKEAWLLKLKIDSVIGQENLNMMRLRRTNLDRIEMAEELEEIRDKIFNLESEIDILQSEVDMINIQSEDCQAVYDALTQKDRQLDRSFKSHFSDLPTIVFDTCYKFFKRRPKWGARGAVTPCVLYELCASVLAAGRAAAGLHHDVQDYHRALENLDQVSNMPNILDEGLWTAVCRQRRHKVENEIRMRAVAQEMAYIDATFQAWSRAVGARRTELAAARRQVLEHRRTVQLQARNKTIQVVLPAGQVELLTTGHFEDFEDAVLIPRDDIETINNLILKVGEMKLRMMRKQMEFRKVILAKEWEHAQMKMKLRHMDQELYSYERLKIPKELQLYLKNITKGITDEQEFVKMEKEVQASKKLMNKMLAAVIQSVEDVEVKIENVNEKASKLEEIISKLNVKVSEKRLYDDPLEPIRRRRAFRTRMVTIVKRSRLIREVQANHTMIVLLQTELELLRLKTYPTLAPFKTLT